MLRCFNFSCLHERSTEKDSKQRMWHASTIIYIIGLSSSLRKYCYPSAVNRAIFLSVHFKNSAVAA